MFMRHFLQPRSIALIGVSSRPNTLSAVLLSNLKESGYSGPVYVVNPNVETIGGLPCYRAWGNCRAKRTWRC